MEPKTYERKTYEPKTYERIQEPRSRRRHAEVPGSFRRGATCAEVQCGPDEYCFSNVYGAGCTKRELDERRLGRGGSRGAEVLWSRVRDQGILSPYGRPVRPARTGFEELPFAGGMNGRLYESPYHNYIQRSEGIGGSSIGGYDGYYYGRENYGRLSGPYSRYTGYGSLSNRYNSYDFDESYGYNSYHFDKSYGYNDRYRRNY